jgi:molybdopterin synthase sulfur carrier subunit
VIRGHLPAHLRTLAKTSSREVELAVAAPVTLAAVVDALEDGYPALRGTIRDQTTRRRRPFIRFFAGEEDLSQESMDAPLPDAVISGSEPLMVVGAMSGG